MGFPWFPHVLSTSLAGGVLLGILALPCRATSGAALDLGSEDEEDDGRAGGTDGLTVLCGS